MAAFKIFFGSQVARWRQALIIICLLAGGLAEGLGLATILPVLVVSTGEAVGQQPEFATQMLDFFRSIGVPTTFTIARLATNYRRRLIDAYLRANWAYFTREPLGKLTYAASSFATGAANAFQTASRFIANLLRTIVYLIVIIIISGQLAVIALGAGLIIIGALHFLVGVARRAAEKKVATSRLISINLTDTFSSIKPLKAMARHSHIHRVFNRTFAKLQRHVRRSVIASQGLTNLQGLLETLAIGVGLYIAVINLQIPILELGVIGGLMLHVTKSVGRLQRLVQGVAVSEVSFLRMNEIIVDAEMAREENVGRQSPRISQGITLENITFSYGAKKVFESASAYIPANRLTVIHGLSGQGKTTLTDLIIGLYRPDHGHILIDGRPLDEIDLIALRKLVGYVPQELVLHNGTIKMNITLGDFSFSDEQVWNALKMANAEQFVSELDKGIHTEIGEQGLKLSGGQRQRISLARALVHQPKLLVLDEVTSALDPETEQEICGHIHEMAKTHTIISITHRPAWIQAADVVLEVSDRQIAMREMVQEIA